MPHLGPFAFFFIFWISAQITSLSIPPKCRYKIEAQEIDFHLSRRIGASFATLQGLKVDSAQACAQACCNESTGQCSLAQYKPQVSSSQCLLLACKPLEACLTTNGSHGWQVAIINRTGLQEIGPSSSTINSDPDLKLSKATTKKQLSIKPTNQPSFQNGYHKNEIVKNAYLNNSSISDSQLSYTKEWLNVTEKNVPIVFNTNIQKGEHVNSQSDDTNMTLPKIIDKQIKSGESNHATTAPSAEIVGTSSAYSYIDNLDAEKNKSSVGRKGVMNPPEDEVVHTILPHANSTSSSSMSSNVPVFSNNSKDAAASVMSVITNKNETVLQNKTLGQLPNAAIISTPGNGRLAVNTSVNANEDLPLSSNLYPTNISLPIVIASVPDYVQHLTPAAVPISEDVQKIIQPSVHDGTSTDSAHTINSTSLFIESQTKNQTEEGLADNQEIDQSKVQAGIHLVVALVIGLLLLLTVVGLIIRRVHDVWQRRHYQRMDFLVDGMYNTVST